MNNKLINAIQSNTGIISNELAQEAQKQLKSTDFIIKLYHNNLNNIEDQLTILQQQKENLIQQITTENTKKFNLQSLFAPYRYIPNELIANILLNTMPDHTQIIPLYEWLDIFNILTNVCIHWRNIAIADPNIWKNLNLTIHSKETKQAYTLLKKWMSYTKTETFNLSIYFPHATTVTNNITHIYNLLHKYNHLTKFTIIVPNSNMEDHINTLSNIKFPKLQSFKIAEKHSYFNNFSIGRRKTKALQMPNLLSLYISTPKTSIINKANLENLLEVHLEFNTARFEGIEYILNNCHKIQKCSLNIQLLPHEINPTKQIFISTLKELNIYYNSNISYILRLLNLPNLEQITLTSENIEADATIITKLTTKSTKIKTINFIGIINKKSIEIFTTNFQHLFINSVELPIIDKIHNINSPKTDEESDSEHDQNASQSFYLESDDIF